MVDRREHPERRVEERRMQDMLVPADRRTGADRRARRDRRVGRDRRHVRDRRSSASMGGFGR
jgi:hypothetical protein